MERHDYQYTPYEKLVHAGIAALGIAAYVASDGAGDDIAASGYLLHAWLGLATSVFVLARLIRGVTGPAHMRFSGWALLSREQWRLAAEDTRSLLKLRIPHRDRHAGLAGIIQASGLTVFVIMCTTGTIKYILRTAPDSAALAVAREIHEIGETLVPLYLILHVGAVIGHSLSGTPVWQKMFSRNRPPDTSA